MNADFSGPSFRAKRGITVGPWMPIASTLIRIVLRRGRCATLAVMMPPRYEIIIYWSVEDQAFIAEVPELAGCAADGATRQEAFLSVEIIIEEWLETARELGRPIPEPKGRLLFA